MLLSLMLDVSHELVLLRLLDPLLSLMLQLRKSLADRLLLFFELYLSRPERVLPVDSDLAQFL